MIVKYFRQWCVVTTGFFISIPAIPMLFEGEVRSALQIGILVLYVCFIIIIEELQKDKKIPFMKH